MNKPYSRREFLRLSGYAGVGLSTLSLWGCGSGGSLDNVDTANGTGNGAGGGGGSPPPPSSGDYKALVNVFLFGGNDAYNLLVPTTPEKYALYQSARPDLLPPSVLPLQGVAADGAAYGLHGSCTDLQGLFNSGRAAMLANVGSLTFPTTRADYLANKVPPRLFSHSDQQNQWQTAHPDVNDPTGWAGRMADVLSSANGSSELPLNISIAGANLMQRGVQTNAFSFSPYGTQSLSNLKATGKAPDLRASFDQIRGLNRTHLFERGYDTALDRGIRLNAMLDDAFKTAPALQTVFPDKNNLALQLKAVAQLMSVRQTVGAKRQVFFVSMGGFDTHDAQNTDQPKLMQALSEALKAFYDATVELGIASNVTTFTSSDFGRTFTTNGKGTDHGWSTHQIILGGAVNGMKIYGTPPSFTVNGSDDTQGGRFIPSTSVDEYGATLARWMGVRDSELNTVFPNLNRFGHRDLGFMLG